MTCLYMWYAFVFAPSRALGKIKKRKGMAAAAQELVGCLERFMYLLLLLLHTCFAVSDLATE